ncbi:MAG: UPF0489 family protein, partial [Candidatus Omnitrophica bacterium]|nr:UPF0489 family protein [Candidatus Omnitrophota bacterium]
MALFREGINEKKVFEITQELELLGKKVSSKQRDQALKFKNKDGGRGDCSVGFKTTVANCKLERSVKFINTLEISRLLIKSFDDALIGRVSKEKVFVLIYGNLAFYFHLEDGTLFIYQEEGTINDLKLIGSGGELIEQSVIEVRENSGRVSIFEDIFIKICSGGEIIYGNLPYIFENRYNFKKGEIKLREMEFSFVVIRDKQTNEIKLLPRRIVGIKLDRNGRIVLLFCGGLFLDGRKQVNPYDKKSDFEMFVSLHSHPRGSSPSLEDLCFCVESSIAGAVKIGDVNNRVWEGIVAMRDSALECILFAVKEDLELLEAYEGAKKIKQSLELLETKEGIKEIDLRRFRREMVRTFFESNFTVVDFTIMDGGWQFKVIIFDVQLRWAKAILLYCLRNNKNKVTEIIPILDRHEAFKSLIDWAKTPGSGINQEELQEMYNDEISNPELTDGGRVSEVGGHNIGEDIGQLIARIRDDYDAHEKIGELDAGLSFYLMQNHGMAYSKWAIETIKHRLREGAILLHIDRHSDMLISDILHNKPISVREAQHCIYPLASFIPPAVFHDLVSEIYWVVPYDMSVEEDKKILVGEQIFSNGQRRYYAEVLPLDEAERIISHKGTELKQAIVHILHLSQLPIFITKNDLILDIDIDFFAPQKDIEEIKLRKQVREEIEGLGSRVRYPAVITLALSTDFTGREFVGTIATEVIECLVNRYNEWNLPYVNEKVTLGIRGGDTFEGDKKDGGKGRESEKIDTAVLGGYVSFLKNEIGVCDNSRGDWGLCWTGIKPEILARLKRQGIIMSGVIFIKRLLGLDKIIGESSRNLVNAAYHKYLKNKILELAYKNGIAITQGPNLLGRPDETLVFPLEGAENVLAVFYSQLDAFLREEYGIGLKYPQLMKPEYSSDKVYLSSTSSDVYKRYLKIQSMFPFSWVMGYARFYRRGLLYARIISILSGRLPAALSIMRIQEDKISGYFSLKKIDEAFDYSALDINLQQEAFEDRLSLVCVLLLFWLSVFNLVFVDYILQINVDLLNFDFWLTWMTLQLLAGAAVSSIYECISAGVKSELSLFLQFGIVKERVKRKGMFERGKSRKDGGSMTEVVNPVREFSPLTAC